ncbi:MAG: oligosaccharide flippase family protein [Solirubrobacterales bacterium]
MEREPNATGAVSSAASEEDALADAGNLAVLPAQEHRRSRFDLQGRSLREHTARGVLINGAFTVSESVLTVVKGFVAAAFISPSQYGIWGILVVTLATLLWLKQVGISDKYIQQDDPDQETAFQKAFTLELLFTAVLACVLGAALPVIVLIYGEADLLLPGLVMLAVLLAIPLQAPIWVYYREMAFVRQRALQAVDPVVATLVTLGLAIAGAGYWSFVFGVLAGAWSAGFAALWFARIKPRFRYDRGTLRSYASFSWPLFIAGGSSLVIAQSATIAVDAELGVAAVGALALAANVTQFTNRVDMLVTTTMYPAVCAARDRLELLHESFVKSNRLALVWAVPFGVALTLFAADLVSFGIGERWRPAVELLQVYGVTAAVAHVGFNWDAYFRARGDTRPIAVANVVTMAAFLACLFPLLAAHGLSGLAVAVAVAAAVHLAARAYYLRRLFSDFGFGFARHAARAIAPTVPAAAVVLAMRVAESGERTLGIALAELAAYGVVALAATWALERGLLREAAGYMRASAGAEAP